MNLKNTICGLFGLIAFVSALVAGTTNVHGFPSLTLSGSVDTDFGEIMYSAAATGSISMGTDGSINYVGGFSGPSVGTAAQFTVIRLYGSSTITISCETGGTMANATGDTIQIDQVEFVFGSGSRTSFGGGIGCAGLGNTVGGTFSLSGGSASRTLYVGMRLNISSPISSGGLYDTGIGGGDDITFEAIQI